MERKFTEILKDIEEGRIKKSKTIGHVDYYILEKTAYSFHFYAVFERNGKKVLNEVLYDLRNKEYFFKRNDRLLKFSVANLDTVIPRVLDSWGSDPFYTKENKDIFFEMVSVEENKGMYQTMIDIIGAIEEERINMSSRALIRLITEYNKLELVYKAGLDISDMNCRQFRLMIRRAGVEEVSKIHQIFGITKSQLKFLKEYSRNHRQLFSITTEGAQCLDQNDMNIYRSLIKLIDELQERYNVDCRMDMFKRYGSVYDLVWAKNRYNRERAGNIVAYGNDFFSLLFETGITNVTRLLEYLLFECFLSQGMDFREAIIQYRDYYNMCKDLKYERFEKYPKYLKTYHDIVARNYKAVQDKVENEAFTKATSLYKDLETNLRDYVVLVPEEPAEVVTEGNVLQHCVSSYIRNVRLGKTKILFLRDRKNQEEPLVTVEVRGDNVVQARGFANRITTPEERAAIHRFAERNNLGVSI